MKSIFVVGLVGSVLIGQASNVFAGGPTLGIDETIVDPSVSPCDNFFQFACGKWLADAKIPDDLSSWDRSFTSLREKNQEYLRKILEDHSEMKGDSRKGPSNPYAAKLGDFYAACMDEKRIEKNSISSLKEEFKEVEALTSANFKERFPLVLARLHLKGVNALFDFGDQQDFKDAEQVIGVVDQGGLSLPDRDYYLKNEPKNLEIQQLFLKNIETLLGMLGISEMEAKQSAKQVFEMEKFLAEHSMSRTDRRNPSNIYHRLERKGLKQKTPSLLWDDYFRESGVAEVQAMNVTVPSFFSSLNQLLVVEKLDELRSYLKWHILSSFLFTLPEPFVAENFKFSSKAFSGQVKIEPRWKRCVKTVDHLMGFALGQSFVELYYGAEGKKRTQALIGRIEKSFEEQLAGVDWMDAKTRKKAAEKVHTLVNKVGYPDVWRKYDSLTIDRYSFFNTVVNAGIFNSRYHLNKIGKPLDRTDWVMTPATVNAYYEPSLNEMVFPAGILQPPFFSANWAHESQYGGIGLVMGHELTHGFDDEGRRYDARGNLKDWWSPKVSRVFEKRTQCMIQNYEKYEPLPGVHLNGKLTLGENIADHGGIRLAYHAWKSEVGTRGEDQVESKYTADQRFFLTFAQSWCSKKREPFARMLVTVDPHSPAEFRVNGSLSQFPRFSEAFKCQAGAKMAPLNRCEVW